MLKLSEIPLLREKLITFIKTERVRSQLREAATRIRNSLQALRFYYEKQLAHRGVHPPFANSWELLQERRFENVIVRQQKELPRTFHNALLELNNRTNSDARFRNTLRPTLNGIKGMVQDAIQREVETLLENYGTEYWDDRDVTYDNLIWGSSGIEIPIKRILFQVELIMQDSVSKFMPEAAEIIAAELERTLEAHEISSRLNRAAYNQEYSYAIPGETADGLNLDEAFNVLVQRVGRNFRHVCQQANHVRTHEARTLRPSSARCWRKRTIAQHQRAAAGCGLARRRICPPRNGSQRTPCAQQYATSSGTRRRRTRNQHRHPGRTRPARR